MDTKLVDLLKWPGVVLILGIIALFLFRTPLTAFINRIRKFGKAGIDCDTPPQRITEEKAGIEEFFKGYDNPLVTEAEDLIRNNLQIKKINGQENREKALIRELATTQLILHAERIYRTIWASQLHLLTALNTHVDGVEIAEAQKLYEVGKQYYPEWYSHKTFDNWIEYLLNGNLIIKKDSRYFLTVLGQEFLKYLLAARLPYPIHG